MSDKMPWFPLEVDRFLNSKRVRRMTAEQVGVYFLLLCEQWKDGALEDDDHDLALIGRAEISVVRSVLEACFKRRRKGWINDTLEEVRRAQFVKAQRTREAARAAGKKSGRVRAQKSRNSNPPPDNNLERPFNDGSTDDERTLNENEQIRLDKKLDKRTSTTTSGHARSRGPDKRWRVCPTDWVPKPYHADLAAELHVNLAFERDKFRDHEFDKLKTDPDKTFANWLRTASERNGNGNGKSKQPKRIVGAGGVILSA